MITKEKFATVKSHISTEILKYMANVRDKNQSHYIMFLSNCRYEPLLENNLLAKSPYTTDNYKDVFADESRIKFLIDYLKLFYSFPGGEKTSVNEEHATHIELMIYTHIWESRPFLRRLLTLSQLLTDKPYNWNPIIPDYNLSAFITSTIAKSFKDCGSELSSIINNGYNQQLRNAFSHSEYEIDSRMNKLRITLRNFKNKPNQIPELFVDEWKLWFVYSILFSYLLHYETYNLRRTIINDLGTNIFKIPIPGEDGTNQYYSITYNKDTDHFYYID
ncbi:MAG: hypothetical protein AB7V36_01465 [Bacteroidales bacterium]